VKSALHGGENVTESAKSKNNVPLETSFPAGAVSLESILCTEELHRRPWRPPDHGKENRALVALVSALADSPRTILQTLAEKVLEVLQADSAGLSLLTKDEKRFYWAAIAGAWQPHIGGGTPRDFGPCGDVLDRNVPMLFTHWERRYPYLRPATPLAEEGLLVPFYVNGKAVGTIWAIAHNDRRKFDAEDLRLLESLGRFASAAYQALASIDDLKFQIAEREKAETALRELTYGLETQVRVRTEELEQRNKQLAEARARLAEEKLYLERSETYLAEAQRLSHTGSFGWRPATGEIVWSEETYRIAGYDPGIKPTIDLVFQRIHPEDIRFVQETLDSAVRDGTDLDFEHRFLMPDGSVKHVHVVAHALRDAKSNLEYVGAAIDITEQHQARAALEKAFTEIKKSEDQLRIIIDTIPTLAWCTLPDGSAEFINQRWLDYMGLSAEEARDWGWRVAIYDEDSTELVETWRAAVATGEPFEAEARLRRADGEYRWFLFRAVPLRDELGNIIQWYGTNTDIEDRKQAEEIRTAQARQAGVRADVSVALSKPAHSGEFLRGSAEAIVRHLDAAFARIWTLNKEKSMLELQASAGRYTHLDGPHSRIPIGKLKIGLIAQEKKPYLTNDVMNDPRVTDKAWAQNEGMVSFAGYPLVVQDRVVGVMAMFARQRLSAATLDTLASVADSIAQGIERKRAEEELRAAETRFRTYVDHATDALFVHDDQRKVVEVNRQACESLGYTREELIGMTPPDFDPALGVDDAFIQWMKERLDAGEVFAFETSHRRKDGTLFPVEVRVRPFWHGGHRFGLALVRDITERQRAEETLRQTQAELAHVARVATLGEMAASIAHEINQPLAAIVNNASASLRWLAANNVEETRHSAEVIRGDAHRAAEIIQRIRSFAKKAPPQKDWIDINQTITEVIALARSEMQRHGVLLEMQLSDAVQPLIFADRVQLQQVILNLIMNAVEAMSETRDGSRELLIRTGTDASGGVVVTVRDSGPGLAPENLDRLFTPFYTTKSQGMGMGLAISRSIIEAHGGRLWAAANEGRGAVFQFTLPTGGERLS
jgi:PAS domain S-box-containing protein